ncbi:hypothetical protein ABVV53_04440 [Novosphingobium sp. RD2P27]|uniref:UrcA family protein n=1 Tax=Novosphingobium kalidii TaxID=3230299 RepID=A0ABV2CYN2_9SPHN
MQWTLAHTPPISAAMANRLFLTLLALLTGLAAQIAPAQARASATEAAAVTVAVCLVARPPAAPVELAQLPEPGRRHARLVASAGGSDRAPLCRTSSVRIGVDRARE